MRVWKMKVIYAAIMLASLAIIGLTLRYFYGRLGGFDDLTVYRLKSENRILVGKRIKSRPTDPAFRRLFVKCQGMITDREINGILTVQNYYYDSLHDQRDQFIGITIENDMAEIPVDFEVYEINTGERLVVFLPMHPLVRPSPERVESIILAQAQEDSVEILPFFNEYHYGDNSMSIEAWIKGATIDTTAILDSLMIDSLRVEN